MSSPVGECGSELGLAGTKSSTTDSTRSSGTAGTRSEEQIAILRALWTNDSITFDGHWEQIDAAGIVPLPIQRPIPIWIGGYAEKTLKRVAAMGDGWFPWREPDALMEATLERLRAVCGEGGAAVRGDRTGTAVECRDAARRTTGMPSSRDGDGRCATHLCLTTMGNGYHDSRSSTSPHSRARQRSLGFPERNSAA